MSNIQSRLSKDIEITGILKFHGELIFEGKFKGDLVQGSSLVIGEGAEVRAKSIVVDNLTSAGLVEGDATVAQRCHLKETAHLQGGLKTFRLAMDDGATFAGALEMVETVLRGAPESVQLRMTAGEAASRCNDFERSRAAGYPARAKAGVS